MRAFGIDEKYITGDAPDYDKYMAWARTVPYTIGNCVYQWIHMELKNPFGITGKLLSPDTAEEIWKTVNSLLPKDEYSACSIIRRMNVKAICTTDDPVDSLEHHKSIRDNNNDFVVVPTFRPDKAMAAENPADWNTYRQKLEEASGISINSFESFMSAIEKRHDFFHSMGARATDHALVFPFAEECSKKELEEIFSRLMNNESLSEIDLLRFKTAVLAGVARMNHKRGWVMQLHMGARRNNNTRMFKKIGPESGFNSMADYVIMEPLAKFLDLLDREDELPKTVLFTLNQNQNDILAAMAGNFIDGRVKGKMQFGAAWWFNDQKDGIERHLTSVANMGMMAVFIGMLTDSRSVYSFIRHEYFRRIVCNLIGRWIEDGDIPRDLPHIGGIVQDICYNNAAEYFGLEGVSPL
jgi:glucuronate isomerase